MKRIKLFVLKVAIIMVTFFWGYINPQKRLPLKWLRHYLIGSGKPLQVPCGAVMDAKNALIRAINADDYGIGGWRHNGVATKGRYCVNSSTLYDGRGFDNRPILFYLVGGFTFELSKRKGKYIIVAEDVYDWNPVVREVYDYDTDEYTKKEFWYCSSLPLWIVHIGKFFFGEEYFTENGWPMGNAGVSNKLWCDFTLVGAKPFTSKIKVKLNLRKEEERVFFTRSCRERAPRMNRRERRPMAFTPSEEDIEEVEE